MIRAICIRGDFDDSDWQELVATIRRIDERHETRDYEITAIDPKATALESAEAIMAALPPQPGRDTAGPVIIRRRNQ